ncbi:MAG: hypothetical protein IKN09_01505 [Clostridia bacterium]|nr:hypothetical protein [Clostridia bacterium]MBR4261060.1 hypothetical protein [Clostridia bacterium]
MEVKEGYVYHIKSEFFDLAKDDMLMKNHEGKATRPHYFCLKNEEDGIIWMIPMSSKVQKYKIFILKEKGINLIFPDVDRIKRVLLEENSLFAMS